MFLFINSPTNLLIFETMAVLSQNKNLFLVVFA